MAFQAWWHEGFAEWPLASVISSFSGTGWSGGANSPICAADANYASGKALEYNSGMSLAASYAFPPFTSGVTWVLTCNIRRLVDATEEPIVTQGCGLRVNTGVAGYWLRIVWGNAGTGLQNTLYLQGQAGSAGTFVTIAQSENIYLKDVKYPMGLVVDWTLGVIQWIVNGEIIFSGSFAGIAGLSSPGITVGRLTTGPSNGTTHYGDFHLYTDSTYLGATEIRTGFPTANEALQDWSFTGAASAWQAISGSLSLVPASYIQSATLGNVSQFECPVSDTNVFAVISGEHQFYAVRTDVSPVDMEAQFGDNVSVANSSTFNPNQAAYQMLHFQFNNINPNTGIAIQPTDLPIAVIGYERTS